MTVISTRSQEQDADGPSPTAEIAEAIAKIPPGVAFCLRVSGSWSAVVNRLFVELRRKRKESDHRERGGKESDRRVEKDSQGKSQIRLSQKSLAEIQELEDK